MKALVWHGKGDFRCDTVPASDMTNKSARPPQVFDFGAVLYRGGFALSLEKVSLNHRLLILLGAGD
jgi:hypothetical protein